MFVKQTLICLCPRDRWGISNPSIFVSHASVGPSWPNAFLVSFCCFQHPRPRPPGPGQKKAMKAVDHIHSERPSWLWSNRLAGRRGPPRPSIRRIMTVRDAQSQPAASCSPFRDGFYINGTTPCQQQSHCNPGPCMWQQFHHAPVSIRMRPGHESPSRKAGLTQGLEATKRSYLGTTAGRGIAVSAEQLNRILTAQEDVSHNEEAVRPFRRAVSLSRRLY